MKSMNQNKEKYRYISLFVLISLNDVSVLKYRLYVCCKNYFRNKIIFFSFLLKKRRLVFIHLRYIVINNNVMAYDL